MTQNVKKPSGLSRTARTCVALLLFGFGGALGGAGCGSSEESDRCRDSECDEGERCVQNACRNACTGDGDCGDGQVCRTYEFRVGDQGDYCVVLPGNMPDGGDPDASTPDPPPGRFTPCESNGECDEDHGFSCMEGECNYPCRSHADCVEVGHCSSRLVDGQRQNYCVHDETLPEPGALYTPCPNGDECRDGRLCLGAGAGDLDAYCSIDCARDADCLPGYYCGTIRRTPCQDACPVDGQPTVEGQPDDPKDLHLTEAQRCVPSELIGEGQPYYCGDLGLERRVCRQREFCTTCETDADCLAVPNQVCARDASGEKICTRLCDVGRRSCPWGNAATCDVFDTELGQATCSHRFGACRGTGEVCEPCTVDADCPGGVCFGQQFTGERWCINLGTRCSCPNGPDATGTCDDGGCPDSPGGLTVLCIGSPTSTIRNICYGGNSSGTGSLLDDSPQTGCWGPN